MDSDHPPARWWPCLCPESVSDLRRLEKKWDFRDSHQSWTWCWNVFRTYMTESVNISLFVQCPGEYSFMRFWLSFFRLGTGFDMKIPRLFFTETFAIRFQNWFNHEWIHIEVFVWMCLISPFSYVPILEFARIALFCCSFVDMNCFR